MEEGDCKDEDRDDVDTEADYFESEFKEVVVVDELDGFEEVCYDVSFYVVYFYPCVDVAPGKEAYDEA